MPRQPLSRPEKSLIWVSLFAVALLGGWGLLTSMRNTSLQVSVPTPVPRPSPNGFDLYVAAAKATVRVTPEADPASDTSVLEPDSPAAKARYSLARRRAWLAANVKTFALVQQATHTPTMHPDVRGNSFGSFTAYGLMRQLARDIAARGRTFQREGKPFEATQSALDGIQMGTDISKNGITMSRLVGIAICAISRDVLEDWNVTIDKLDARQCRLAATRLETILRGAPTMKEILEEDRWVSLKEFQTVSSGPNWRSLPTEANWKDRLAAQIISRGRVADDINAWYDQAIVLSQKPYSLLQANPSIAANDPLCAVFADTNLVRWKRNEARGNVGLELLLLRLALRAYRLEHGAYPKTLGVLAPAYLKTIPTDDYGDDKPYFYRLKGQTFELWSIGSDGKNDNGKPFPTRNPKTTRQASDVYQGGGDFVAGKNR